MLSLNINIQNPFQRQYHRGQTILSYDQNLIEHTDEVKDRVLFCPRQGFHQSSQMLYNIIFPAETNFPIRSRYVFYFMFSLTFKAFVTFVTIFLFQSNLYTVLAHGKGPKNSIHRNFFKTKKT